MIRKLTVTELKAEIFAVLDGVAAGDEVEITKHGRTVARLVPAHRAHALRGRFAGVAMSASDDEELFSTPAFASRPADSPDPRVTSEEIVTDIESGRARR